MKKLVTISREYGSGGRIIGKILAEKLGVPFYDKEIIDMAVQESGFSREMIESAELKAKSSFAYNLASALNFSEGMSSSPLSVNEKLFLAQFQVIAEIGNKEEGVIVGREYKNYNLAINSSYITEEEAAMLIKDYVERRTYR